MRYYAVCKSIFNGDNPAKETILNHATPSLPGKATRITKSEGTDYPIHDLT